MRVFCLIGLILMSISTSAAEEGGGAIPLGTDTRYRGYISEGSKFGVAIGDTRSEAEETLGPKSRRVRNLSNCTDYLSQVIGCSVGQQIDHQAYRIGWPLRDGQIIIVYEEETVASIIWSFVLIPPI